MNVAILVPRRSDGGRRDLTWDWVKARWAAEHPGWTVVEGHHDEGPFNRSKALNTAAELAPPADVYMVADADSFVGPDQAEKAVQVADLTGQITFAYHEFRYLSRKMTARVMAGFRGNWFPGVEFTLSNTCSSMVAVPRKLWEDVGGFDEGFVGWGFEDVAFSLACQAFGDGMQRITGDVWHLYHQPSPENQKGPLYQANLDRMNRYRDCDYDLDKTRALLTELGVVAPPRYVEGESGPEFFVGQ